MFFRKQNARCRSLPYIVREDLTTFLLPRPPKKGILSLSVRESRCVGGVITCAGAKELQLLCTAVFLLSTSSIAYLCKYIKAKSAKSCTNIYVQICLMCIYVLSSVLCYTSFKYLIGEKEVVTMSPASKAQQKAVNKYMKKTMTV